MWPRGGNSGFKHVLNPIRCVTVLPFYNTQSTVKFNGMEEAHRCKHGSKGQLALVRQTLKDSRRTWWHCVRITEPDTTGKVEIPVILVGSWVKVEPWLHPKCLNANNWAFRYLESFAALELDFRFILYLFNIHEWISLWSVWICSISRGL